MKEKTYTFTSCCGRYRFTVKTSFTRFCNPESWEVYELMSQYGMAKYLHNELGPAIEYVGLPYKDEYWLNGEKLPQDNAEKMLHNHKFNDRIKGLLDD